jgi:hypothetical protein
MGGVLHGAAVPRTVTHDGGGLLTPMAWGPKCTPL